MGSGSSHLVSPPQLPKRNKVNRTKQRLASFICGASSSSSSSQKEDCAAECSVNFVDCRQQKSNNSSSYSDDIIPTSSLGSGFSSDLSHRSGPIASSENCTISSDSASILDDAPLELSNKRSFSEGGENDSSLGINAERKVFQQRLVDSVNPSSARHLRQVSLTSNRRTTNEIDEVINDMSGAIPEVSSRNGLQQEELEQSAVLDEVSGVTGSQSSVSGQALVESEPVTALHSHGDEAIHEMIPSGLDLFVSDRAEARPEGSSLHVDVMSFSSNLLPSTNNEISTREARRNSRRMFWDAFSSRNSRRHAELLFTTEDSDLMGSNRRWLLDIGDDFFDDGVGVEPWRFGRRSRFTNDRRRTSRSEFWDRLRGVSIENSHHTSCPMDLHPDGSCTCDLEEEASALSSISRIILLAEALFEVLDEIHRQPESLSLSMLSVPAPESVVDELPIKIYEKLSMPDHEDDTDQCYICLVEYEKGDKIRVLPCHHAYHMSCVDKWLKEIHGVCPLCRGDVREGAREVAASSSDANLA
ncbi:unnamed protein product [Amaranthus hypochondriacus]